MKKFYFMATLVLLISLLIACQNNDESENGAESSEKDTVSQETSTDVKDDDNETESVTNEEPDENGDVSTSDEIKILSIGETALISSTLGDYKVTPEEINFVDSVQGYSPVQGKFVETTVKINNVSGEAIEIFPITSGDGKVFAQTKDRLSRPELVEVEGEVEEIQPNETVTVKIIFDVVEDSQYHLAFGDQLTANEVHWEFLGE